MDMNFVLDVAASIIKRVIPHLIIRYIDKKIK